MTLDSNQNLIIPMLPRWLSKCIMRSALLLYLFKSKLMTIHLDTGSIPMSLCNYHDRDKSFCLKRTVLQKRISGLFTKWPGVLWMRFVREISWPEMKSIAGNDDRQCCQKILYLKYYTLFWQSLRIIFYLYIYLYFFQSNTFKILYYRIKLSKRIKSTLFILFSLNIWYISAVYRPMSIFKKNFTRSFGACISNTTCTYIFQVMLF